MSTLTSQPPDQTGPAWDIARLFPNQGHWGEGDYLELNRRTNHLVELIDGHIEVLDTPTKTQQRMVLHLYNALLSFAGSKKLGEVLVAPYPVRLRAGKFREPDVVFMLTEHAERMREDYADRADLVMEVVSEDRRRDMETKRAEYAEAGIPEYWIVDPREQNVIVLRLSAGSYMTHSEAHRPGVAASRILPGFTVDLGDLFGAIGTKSPPQA